jgi:hypothetical protein
MFAKHSFGVITLYMACCTSIWAEPNRIPVLPEMEIFPGAATITSEALYFAELNSDKQCRENDLYRVMAGKTAVEKIAEIPCIQSIQTVDDKVFIESRKSATREAVESEPVWSVWDGKAVVTLDTAFPQFQKKIPTIRMKLYSLGAAKDASAGHWMRKATFRSLYWHGGGQKTWTALMLSPVEAGSVPRYALATGSLDEKANIKAVFLDIPEGYFVQRIAISDHITGFAVLADGQGKQRIEIFNFATGAKEVLIDSGVLSVKTEDKEEAIVGLGNITSLIVSGYADAFIVDSGDGLATDSAVWRFDTGSRKLVKDVFPSRDITSVNRSANGMLVSRRSGVSWWGSSPAAPVISTLSKTAAQFPSLAAVCPSYRLVKGEKEHTLFSRQTVSNGDTELVALMDLQGLNSFQCGKATSALLADSFRPRIHPGRLKVALRPGSEFPLSNSNVDEVVALENQTPTGKEIIHTAKAILISLDGAELKWARTPVLGTEFGALTPVGKDDFEVALKDTGLDAPYPYSLRFDAKSGRIRHVVPAKAQAATVFKPAAAADAKSELAVFSLKEPVRLFSFREKELEPALGTFVEGQKAIYFAERGSGACPGRNLWKVSAPESDARAKPVRVGIYPCITSLFTDSRVLWIGTSSEGKRETLAWSEDSKKSTSWWKGLSADELWKIDLWIHTNKTKLDIRELRLVALKRDGQSVRLLLRPRSVSTDGYVVYLSTKPEDETQIPPSVTLKSQSTAPEGIEFAMAQNGNVFEFRNFAAPNQLAQLVCWKLTESAGQMEYVQEVIMGQSTPYLYREVWDALSADDWSARRISHPAVTSRGLVFLDGTTRLNEWPVGTYYSADLQKAPDTFTRIQGLSGAHVAGLQFVSNGLLVSDRYYLSWIGGEPPIKGDAASAASNEEEIIREDSNSFSSGGSKE